MLINLANLLVFDSIFPRSNKPICSIHTTFVDNTIPYCLHLACKHLLSVIENYQNMKLTLLCLLIMATQALAQSPKLYNFTSNEVHMLHSQELQQDRPLYIHVPKLDSSDLNTPLPTLYLLDGDNHFHILSAYIDYLRHWKLIPPMIVVGIISVDRKKDLTPVQSMADYFGKADSSLKNSGGNAQFFKFIKNELIPYMEATYKSSPYRIFAGHSFGGITTINCMLTQPDLFDSYIAISPSFWFGQKYMLSQATQKLPSLKNAHKKLFYSVGNEGGTFRNDVLKFDKLVQQNSSKSFQHMYKYYPNEDHMSEPVPAYYDALRFIFKNWK